LRSVLVAAGSIGQPTFCGGAMSCSSLRPLFHQHLSILPPPLFRIRGVLVSQASSEPCFPLILPCKPAAPYRKTTKPVRRNVFPLSQTGSFAYSFVGRERFRLCIPGKIQSPMQHLRVKQLVGGCQWLLYSPTQVSGKIAAETGTLQRRFKPPFSQDAKPTHPASITPWQA
jgi:hypothetical protein